MVTNNLKTIIVNGFRNGLSLQEISDATGCPKSTCHYWVKSFKKGNIEDPQIEEHSHYYILESPNGKTSKGICKYCLDVRTHYNSKIKDSTVRGRDIYLGRL